MARAAGIIDRMSKCKGGAVALVVISQQAVHSVLTEQTEVAEILAKPLVSASTALSAGATGRGRADRGTSDRERFGRLEHRKTCTAFGRQKHQQPIHRFKPDTTTLGPPFAGLRDQICADQMGDVVRQGRGWALQLLLDFAHGETRSAGPNQQSIGLQSSWIPKLE